MWNRVALLAAGVAFGWSLVNYWTVAAHEVRTQRIRLIISALVAALVIVLLAVESAQAAIAGAFVFLFSAVVAYAGNAKQVSKVEQDIPYVTPERPLESDPRTVVLLITEGEPQEYDGSETWARRFKRREAQNKPVPNWFVRPLAYARIRQAYQAMGGQNPFAVQLGRLSASLQEQLGDAYRVELVYLDAKPRLATLLYRLAENGAMQITLIPISLQDRIDEMYAHVTRSRVREIGVRVQRAATLELTAWSNAAYEARMDRFTQGEPVVPGETWDEQTLEELRARVAP
ncbi:MAG: hypothetical protein GX552_13110, partial [Chloroflexi bacterium]|nr:hypothetical protein [Chloroflexota bacterium]